MQKIYFVGKNLHFVKKKVVLLQPFSKKRFFMINITFPDNSVRQFEAGVTPLDIAKSLSEGLARNVLSAKMNGKMWDAMRPINEDATIQLFTWDDPEGKATF